MTDLIPLTDAAGFEQLLTGDPTTIVVKITYRGRNGGGDEVEVETHIGTVTAVEHTEELPTDRRPQKRTRIKIWLRERPDPIVITTSVDPNPIAIDVEVGFRAHEARWSQQPF
ncbi:hypothetical protein ACFVU2_19300 [Leifsonia sp. NPDC058194]|uniref:hypothetical protein n=1 Tax=Leifsonia sp. NPDC058194 TaxID=3346374 RepID=UPI0036DE5B8C